jgi:hypothetical protein
LFDGSILYIWAVSYYPLAEAYAENIKDYTTEMQLLYFEIRYEDGNIIGGDGL